MRERKYKFFTCHTVDEDDIVFAEYHANLKVDLAIAQEMVANRMEFTQNKPHYVVIDISNVKQVSIDAKKYMQQPDGGLLNILGAAFIANNVLAALLANIFIKTPKDFESRFFSSKEAAITWIKELRMKNMAA